MERLVLLIGILLPAHNLKKLAEDLAKLLKKKTNAHIKGKVQVQELEELTPVPDNFMWRLFDDHCIAEQLTLLDHLGYCAIRPSELLGRGWVKKDKLRRSPNVVHMLSRFNYLTNWVTREILNFNTPTGRSRAITRFISIASVCNSLFYFILNIVFF